MPETTDEDVERIARGLSPLMRRSLVGNLYRCNWNTFRALRDRGLVATVPPRSTDLGLRVAAALSRTEEPPDA
jgi:hypothetical protein